jgi:superfamily II DNA or RNA helicase
MLSPLTYRLQPWQQEALTAWRGSVSPELGPRHGVAEVFTGAGKTILAMGCMADAQAEEPDLQFAVVVPTCAIARQWQKGLAAGFGLPAKEIGLRMSGKRGSLASHQIVIYVINSARKCLESETRGRKVMLIVDECHRAGSKDNLGIFKASTRFRLGLSATAGRDDMLDEVGNPIPAVDQPHIKALGPICYRLDIKRARSLGLLPRYEIHHHRLPMSEPEAEKYEVLSREVQDLKDELRRTGVSPEACNKYCTRPPPHATPAQLKAARALQAAIFRRKQWLYGVSSRNAVARLIVADAAKRFSALGVKLRGLAFNERIDPWQDPDLVAGDSLASDSEQPADEEEEPGQDASDADDVLESTATSGAAALWESLRADARTGELVLPTGEDGIAIYHSRLGSREREKALHDFGKGSTSLLVSVKALIEGLDVPDANIGLSVASTSSGRQRIQTMGRILRAPRDTDGNPLPADVQAAMPAKEIHLLYVGNTVDEEIYIKTNWSDLTGEAENKWWQWDVTDESPLMMPDSSPPKPPPTEEEAWAAIATGPLPATWTGSTRGSRWSYRQNSVYSEIETEAIKPEQAISVLEAASSRIGDCRGKFIVTPRLHVILKRAADQTTWLAVGRLDAPLTARPREPRPVRERRPGTAALSQDEQFGSQAPEWESRFTKALVEIGLFGTIDGHTRTALDDDPLFPEALKVACRTYETAAPATREPQGLLTKSLLVETLVRLRAQSRDRVVECMESLASRSEPWSASAASAIEHALGELAKSEGSALTGEEDMRPRQHDAGSGTVPSGP